MTKQLRPITKEEWEQYAWVEATGFGGDPDRPVFIRGIKYTEPPDDGYVYKERTRLGDSEQRWVRAMTYAEPE